MVDIAFCKWIIMPENEFSEFMTKHPDCWSDRTIQGIRDLWRAFTNADGSSFELESRLVRFMPLADLHKIVSCYTVTKWDDRFNRITEDDFDAFAPPPELPTLMASCGQPHYLWFASSLQEIMLMFWIHVRQDAALFYQAVDDVWSIMRQRTKFEEGFSGANERLIELLISHSTYATHLSN